MNNYEQMMYEVMLNAKVYNTVRLMSGEREVDPGATYYFYYDTEAEQAVSPYFHSRANAERWLYLSLY